MAGPGAPHAHLLAGLPDAAKLQILSMLNPTLRDETTALMKEAQRARRPLPALQFTFGDEAARGNSPSSAGAQAPGRILADSATSTNIPNTAVSDDSASHTDDRPPGEEIPPREIVTCIDTAALDTLTAEDLGSLNTDGFVIVDNFLGTDELLAVRSECELWLEGGKLRQANMGSGDKKWGDEQTRGDLIAWVHDRDLSEVGLSSPHISALLARLRAIQAGLNAACPAFNSEQAQTMITCYPGNGARYVRHLDAHTGGPTRRITLLYYVNPGYEKRHGGALRIYLPQERTGVDSGRDTDSVPFAAPRELYVDIEPLGDRLLVFQSRMLEHEVLESHAKRFAVTTWLY